MPISTVAYKPVWIAPAYNPIMWSVLSNRVNSTDFKYVFDIYEVGSAAPIQRIRQRANPTGYGMIDISTLVQGYLDSSNPNSAMTQGELTIDWDNGKSYADNIFMSKKYYMKIGEEYTDANGLSGIRNGLTDTLGEPAYTVYSGNTQNGNLTTPVTAFCASMTDLEQQWQMRSTYQSGIFGGNPFDDDVNYDKNYGLAHPLNYASLEQDIYKFDNGVLSYINWSPVTSGSNYVLFGFRFQKVGVNDTILNTADVPMLTSTGFGQRTACTDTVNVTLDAKYSLVHVLTCPDKVAYLNGWTAFQPGEKLTVQGFYRGTTGCTFGAAATKESVFNILEYCEPLYPRVRLSWFNTLGGRDYMNFTMFTEKSINSTQSNYSQEQLNYSGSTPVPVVAPTTQPFGNTAVRGGNKPYAKQVETSYTIMTDWLEQEQVDLIEGLVMSPQVLAYIKDPINKQADNIPYNCTVTTTSYTTKNVRQTKLVQATINIKLAIPQNIQTL
ncbi:hypothetical protein UFOVP643_20 [uncultured Caudovirales phage]|uniref:Uncharacterized protein n=1 Tax=uncultured Caudovirales phage TaxID=2100421 RepID=A0A6J5N875_9CAUD|nr:hypothetical protein UFOVP282_15 [uncultured Caudovirales phage]CAB4154672.1 hypothetical protein UFOVP643_20 [uncultured Caudovirales phage]